MSDPTTLPIRLAYVIAACAALGGVVLGGGVIWVYWTMTTGVAPALRYPGMVVATVAGGYAGAHLGFRGAWTVAVAVLAVNTKGLTGLREIITGRGGDR